MNYFIENISDEMYMYSGMSNSYPCLCNPEYPCLCNSILSITVCLNQKYLFLVFTS